MPLSYLESNSKYGTIAIAMDSDDPEEPVLIRDRFKVGRENFLVPAPVEASYPSTTQIVISWTPIPQEESTAEERILYYR